ncbi:hypothetical protein GN958_ATG02314 [Phytophthora infestans]|uniref:BED-type domain-containing protein n=1 Tax=Phytophthora infestans TaxID=4787 RepID=A0A8S9V7D9_PHYIN|nr:hypothetical protein GN958_ATG02314 [Phytophthora infestans]
MGDAGGRPERQESKHFKRLPELGTAKGGYSYRECKFCRAAFQNEVTTTPPKPIIGRVRNYQSHLAKCTYYKAAQLCVEPLASLTVVATPDVVQRVTLVSSVGGTTSEVLPTTPPPVASQTRSQYAGIPSRHAGSRTARPAHARRSLILEKRPSPAVNAYNLIVKKTKKEKRRFSKSEIRQIECYLIELHADNHLPDRHIEQASVLRFLELLCPGISDVIPSRRT